MHGFLWSLHKSHHEPREGAFEKNDWFAVFFAAIAITMFAAGAWFGWTPLSWAAAGVTAYGVLYALAHDALVHRRFPFRLTPRGRYLKQLVQAHRLHHAVRGKEGGVSFGFLIPPDVARLRERLRASGVLEAEREA
mgnify:CR=1 FL=1